MQGAIEPHDLTNNVHIAIRLCDRCHDRLPFDSYIADVNHYIAGVEKDRVYYQPHILPIVRRDEASV
jgi:hypothetical protein